jgi:hypothetical protein
MSTGELQSRGGWSIFRSARHFGEHALPENMDLSPSSTTLQFSWPMSTVAGEREPVGGAHAFPRNPPRRCFSIWRFRLELKWRLETKPPDPLLFKGLYHGPLRFLARIKGTVDSSTHFEFASTARTATVTAAAQQNLPVTRISFVLAEGDRNSLDITFVHVPTGSTAKGGRRDSFATRYRSALMRRRYTGWAPSSSHSFGGVPAPFLLPSLLAWYAG